MKEKSVSINLLSDFVTRIRNANIVYKNVVTVPANRLTKEIAKILRLEGFIDDFQLLNTNGSTEMRIYLKYESDKRRCLNDIVLVSTPGRRVYSSVDSLPRVKRGIGVAIVSTPYGVMTDKQARKIRQGGEIICYVW